MSVFECVREDNNGSAEFVTFSSDDCSSHVTYGLNRLGSGISREVYALSSRHVVKVQTPTNQGPHGTANQNECDVWQEVEGTEHESFFAKIFAWADDYSWVIAERAEYVGDIGDNVDEWNNAMCEIGICDLHPGNYGIREDGSMLVIDYGSGGGNFADFDEMDCNCGDCQEWCECGACGCTDCHPDGCECETFDGCRIDSKQCERCDENRIRYQKLFARQERLKANGTWNGTTARWARDGLLGHCAELPTDALERVRDRARTSVPVAHTRRNLVLSNIDTSADDYPVCTACAQELDDAPSSADIDRNQMILEFPDRFQIGLVVRDLWSGTLGGMMLRVPCYYAKDRLKVYSQRDYAVILPAKGAQGFAIAQAQVNALNAGRDNLEIELMVNRNIMPMVRL